MEGILKEESLKTHFSKEEGILRPPMCGTHSAEEAAAVSPLLQARA